MNLLSSKFFGTRAKTVSKHRWRKLRVRPDVILGRLNSTNVALHMAFT